MRHKKSTLLLLYFVSFFAIITSIAIVMATSLYTKPQLSQQQNQTSGCNDNDCIISSLLEEQHLLEKRFQNNEAASQIYNDILIKYADDPPPRQHGMAHIFGEELYKYIGVSGITLCNESFAFGCFHGFFTNVIPKQGVQIVKELDQMCIDKFGEYNLGCQHGIGHGIAEYFGPQGLNVSLETCATLKWKYQLMGCPGGVFMEYLMPTSGDSTPGSVFVKPINAENPYSPCLIVKDQFQAECYYNLGNYFYHATSQNSKEVLKLCQKVSNSFYRKTCLLGLGNSIYSNTRDINKTISECKSVDDKNSEINCRSGAGWILYSDTKTRKKANLICEGLDEVSSNSCRDNIDLINLAKN